MREISLPFSVPREENSVVPTDRGNWWVLKGQMNHLERLPHRFPTTMNVSKGFGSVRFLWAHTSSIPPGRKCTHDSVKRLYKQIQDNTFDLLDFVLRNPNKFALRNPITEEENACGGLLILLPPVIDGGVDKCSKVCDDLRSRGLECWECSILGGVSIVRIDKTSNRWLLNTRAWMSHISTFKQKQISCR